MASWRAAVENVAWAFAKLKLFRRAMMLFLCWVLYQIIEWVVTPNSTYHTLPEMTQAVVFSSGIFGLVGGLFTYIGGGGDDTTKKAASYTSGGPQGSPLCLTPAA